MKIKVTYRFNLLFKYGCKRSIRYHAQYTKEKTYTQRNNHSQKRAATSRR